MAEKTVDLDVIFNRTNVALAKSQRLVQSWLGPAPGGASDGQDLWRQDADDDDDFQPVPETLGVGAQVPDAEIVPGLRTKAPSSASKDRLLEQLIGKKAAKEHREKLAAMSRSKAAQSVNAQHDPASKPAARGRPPPEEESDHEESRASAVGSKRARKAGRSITSGEAAKGSNEDAPPADDGASRTSKRRRPAAAGSYLDQILAEKALKKKRKETKA